LDRAKILGEVGKMDCGRIAERVTVVDKEKCLDRARFMGEAKLEGSIRIG